MRVLLAILVLLPIVYCASIEERFIFGSFTAEHLAEELIKVLGSDTSEQACELACPSVLATVPGGALLGSLCGPACQYVQTLVQG